MEFFRRFIHIFVLFSPHTIAIEFSFFFFFIQFSVTRERWLRFILCSSHSNFSATNRQLASVFQRRNYISRCKTQQQHHSSHRRCWLNPIWAITIRWRNQMQIIIKCLLFHRYELICSISEIIIIFSSAKILDVKYPWILMVLIPITKKKHDVLVIIKTTQINEIMLLNTH